MATPTDPLVFLSGGAIQLVLDGARPATVTLRAPKMREFRALREELWEIDDEIDSFVDKAQPEVEHPVVLARLKRQRDIDGTRLSEDLRGTWAAGVIATLGGLEVEADDLPAYCPTAAFAAELARHWVGVPHNVRAS